MDPRKKENTEHSLKNVVMRQEGETDPAIEYFNLN